MTNTTSPSVQKALTKLEASISSGQAYEGHELFKTIFYRSRARKQLEDSYALAEGGSVLQLQKGQENCGTELGSLLLEAYTTDTTPATLETVQRVLNIIQAFSTTPCADEEDPPIEQCNKILSSALKWLVSVDGLKFAPSLHAAYASYLYQSLGWTGLGLCIPHYAISNNFDEFAKAIVTCAQKGKEKELDLFLARAVLQILSSKALPGQQDPRKRAAEYLSCFAKQKELPHTPLMHFIELYMEALEKKSSPLVDLLLQKYKPSLERDPSLMQLIAKSRGVYAPVPPRGSAGGMFGDLMRSMMQGA